MSVINQMLKDLEERAPKSPNTSEPVVATAKKTSAIKVISISLIMLVIINGLGLYIWSLVQQNKALKEKTLTLQALTTTAQHKAVAPERKAIRPAEIKLDSQAKITLSVPERKNLAQTTTKAPTTLVGAETLTAEVSKEVISEVISSKTVAPKVTVSNVSVAKSKLTNIDSAMTSLDKPTASMSVSRRQLTSAELIEHTLVKAEKAINSNKLSKAEQLFEEVLILEPRQHQARKKLAALWFGRKAFNDASNLLAQGIALAPNNSEFRSMQAHIFLQQGRLTQAYNSLKPLASLQQEAYQLLLVNISQQLSEYDAAINAYKILLDIQPENSRWHLGLATIYDQTSEFVLAVSEYHLALAQGGLSQDSSRFVHQRIQALGVK